jgi:hypothetical protein
VNLVARVAEPVEDLQRALRAPDGRDVERQDEQDVVGLVERRQGDAGR